MRSKIPSKLARSTLTVLEAESIRHFDKEIRQMSRSELVKNFAAASSGRVLLAHLMKNLIWQAYEMISAKQAPPITGNIRTFWYLWVKPVLSRLPNSDLKTDPYATMISIFTRMVMELQLFHYSDFDFTDENWENRRIGTARPETLVFSEKAGWIRFLMELHEELGVSILALGGFPSALTSEYTAKHIQEAFNGEKEINLIGIVDYDPSGNLIANAFQEQLAAVGLTKTKLTTVIHPRHYTKEEIEMFKFQLPKTEKTKLMKWLEQTGGIDGKAYGLESESMPRERLKELLQGLILSGDKEQRRSKT